MPLIIAASMVLASAAVRTQSVQEIVGASAAPGPELRAAVDVTPPPATAQSAPATLEAASRKNPPNALFASLYTGFAVTQALDVHSTLRALDAGHREANPMMRWATERPAAFVALKAATTTGTLLVVERLRKRHPKGALVLMAAIDTACSLVVVRNYNVPVGRR